MNKLLKLTSGLLLTFAAGNLTSSEAKAWHGFGWVVDERTCQQTTSNSGYARYWYNSGSHQCHGCGQYEATCSN